MKALFSISYKFHFKSLEYFVIATEKRNQLFNCADITYKLKQMLFNHPKQAIKIHCLQPMVCATLLVFNIGYLWFLQVKSNLLLGILGIP